MTTSAPKLAILFAVTFLGQQCAQAQQPDRAISRLPAGTRVEHESNSTWNRIVLLSKPRIISGQVESIPAGIREVASSFVLTILASVESFSDNAGRERFRLADVGIGYSTLVEKRLTVVTSETNREIGANLGLFGSWMLKTNESQLDTAQFVAKTSTLYLFDVPALMLREGKHVEFVMRHFIWLNSRSGKCSCLVWLIDPKVDPTAVDGPLRWIPENTIEDRDIHVDSNQFVVGFPTDRAFALEKLPPGRDVQWTTDARQLAAIEQYDSPTLKSLTEALNACLQSLRGSQ